MDNNAIIILVSKITTKTLEGTMWVTENCLQLSFERFNWQRVCSSLAGLLGFPQASAKKTTQPSHICLQLLVSTGPKVTPFNFCSATSKALENTDMIKGLDLAWSPKVTSANSQSEEAKEKGHSPGEAQPSRNFLRFDTRVKAGHFPLGATPSEGSRALQSRRAQELKSFRRKRTSKAPEDGI